MITVLYGGGRAQEIWARALDRAREDVSASTAIDVIAVDNHGGVAEPASLPKGARLIDPGRNIGFAAGCNRGIEAAAEGSVVVLLNPDVEVSPGFLAQVAGLEWPEDLAARGPAVRTPDGGVEQSARGFPTARTGLLGRTSLLARMRPSSRLVQRELRATPGSGTQVVDWVSGACLIAPRDRFDVVGPLDEGYFMYWEDADWCRRSLSAGMRVEYEPSLSVVHHQGSTSAARPLMTIIAFHRSAFRYWRLHVSRSLLATGLGGAVLACRCTLKLAAAVFRSTPRRNGP